MVEAEHPGSPDQRRRSPRRCAAALGFAPERVLVVAPRTIPSTLNGKVRHLRLRELLAQGAFG